MLKLLLMVTLAVSLSAKEANVHITSTTSGAILYVDGKEIGVMDKMMYDLLLEDGKHEIMLAKTLDEDWQEVQRKKVLIEKDTPLKLKFSLNLEKVSKKMSKNTKDNFRKKGDIVLDSAAQLLWQDNKNVTEVKKSWFESEAYCHTLSLGGLTGWRVPTYDELIGMVDYTKHTLAAMPAFEHVISEYYWTSNEDETNSKNAKNVYFGNGCPNTNLKENKYYIRCVHTQ